MLDESTIKLITTVTANRAETAYVPFHRQTFTGPDKPFTLRIVVKADTNISRTGVLPGYKTTVLSAMPMARKPLRLMLRAITIPAASTALSGYPRAY